jgi:hypothetical protein
VNAQGWDHALFVCGACGTVIRSDTDREYIRLVNQHRAECAGRRTDQ